MNAKEPKTALEKRLVENKKQFYTAMTFFIYLLDSWNTYKLLKVFVCFFNDHYVKIIFEAYVL